MRIAVTLVATGRYITYANNLIKSLAQFFPPHDVIVFTDNVIDDRPNLTKIAYSHLGWPQVTMRKFHAHLAQRELLSKYDYIIHLDADMLAVNKIAPEEIFTQGISATLHPSYPNTFERNPNSAAYVEGNPTYFHTAPIAGDAKSFLAMCAEIVRTIDMDEANGIMAVWHDESHVNRYLASHPPAKVLTPLYCFPAPQYIKHEQLWTKGVDLNKMVVKIRHIEKPNKSQFRKTLTKKVLVGIISCQKHRELQSAQRMTWLRDLPNDMHRFFLGGTAPEKIAQDEVFLPVGDGRDEEMTAKVHAMFKWALENEYTHVWKGDVDTLCNARNLLNSGFESHDFIGGKNIYFASGGSGYWVSRRAMELIVAAPPFEHGIQKDEDVTTFKILEQNGIALHDDHRYKFAPGEKIDASTISFHLSSCFGWGHAYDPETMYTGYKRMRQISITGNPKPAADRFTKEPEGGLGAWVWRDGRKIRLDSKGNVIDF